MNIAFISYPAINLDKAVEFYQKVIGIEPLFHRKDWAEFKIEEQRFALQKVEIAQKGKNNAMIYFMSKTIDQDTKRLKSFGAKVLGSIEIKSYGKFAKFQDPEGNIFGLYQPPIK